MRCTRGAHLGRCLQSQYAVTQLCWRFIPALSQAAPSCLAPDTTAHTLALLLTTAHCGHTMYLYSLLLSFSSVKQLYSQVKIPRVHSHAPKSSSAWAPALPQSWLLVGSRRRPAPTPAVTSPGWEGEGHGRFSCGCQSLGTHRARSSRCWTMRSKALPRQASCVQEGLREC